MSSNTLVPVYRYSMLSGYMFLFHLSTIRIIYYAR